MSEFKVLHLSDLHFYNHKGTTSSLGYRMKIKEHCERNKYDLYVISGDLTDDGRKDSFLDAYDWLFGDGENSLALPKHKTIVVPGNHDAFNKNDNDYVVNVGRGEIDGRIQKCLDNYHEIFNEYKYEHTNINKGVNCKWFPVVENDGIFVISLSSCYLGDPFKNLMPVGVGTALGQLASEQIEYIFSICDKGLKGELKDSDGELVKGDAFSRSVKILVMHHFLFNIYSGKEKGILEKINNQYFMKIKKREMVLQNLMMADIDFVVCGHSHIGDVGEHTFECHFKNKYARERILMNYFRKKCGFCSKPIIEKFKNGQFLGKPYRVICEMSVRIGKRGEDLADLFAYGLDPTQNRSLRNGIRDILKQAHGSYVAGYDDREDAKVLAEEIKKLDPVQRKKINKIISEEINKYARRLSHRGTIQCMSGSTIKPTSEKKDRGFCAYSISLDQSNNCWIVKSQHYQWSYTRERYEMHPHKEHTLIY